METASPMIRRASRGPVRLRPCPRRALHQRSSPLRAVLRRAHPSAAPAEVVRVRPDPRREPQARLARLATDPRPRSTSDGFRSPWIEGYCSQAERQGRRVASTSWSRTDPPRRFQIEIFRMGYYGGRGARLMTTLGPFEGKAQPTPTPGPKDLHECRWEPSTTLDDPRTTGPAASTSAGSRRCPTTRRRALLAELRRLHRPRRPPGRHPLPVLRQHLAGVQPLAEQLLALHPPEGQPGPLGRRQLRPPLRPRGPVRRRRQRPAHRRLGRVPAVRVPARLLAGAARLRRDLLLQQRHAHARSRPEVQGVPQRRPRRVLGHPPVPERRRRCATPA